MSNPVLNSSSIFGGNAQPYQANPAPTYQGQQSPNAAPQTLDAMYSAPAATSVDTDRMTYDDVIVKTGGLFLIIVALAAVSWQLTSSMPSLWVIGLVGGLVFGLINAFKREPSPVLIVVYAAFEGVFLGGISAMYHFMWDGIVLQAVLATFAVFAVSLLLFRSGKVRVTPKFTKFLLIAISGYLVFSLANLLLVWTGVLGGWGMRGGGFGIAIGLFAVGLAAMSLIADFDQIQRGVEGGAPRKFAWAGAFGLIVTLVWLYLELLRLFAILRGD